MHVNNTHSRVNNQTSRTCTTTNSAHSDIAGTSRDNVQQLKRSIYLITNSFFFKCLLNHMVSQSLHELRVLRTHRKST